MTKEGDVGMIIFFSCLKKSVPIRAWKCNFSFLKEIMTGRQTDQPHNGLTNQPTDGPEGS